MLKIANRPGGEADGYANVVSLAELYYILHRRSQQVAVEKEKSNQLYRPYTYNAMLAL